MKIVHQNNQMKIVLLVVYQKCFQAPFEIGVLHPTYCSVKNITIIMKSQIETKIKIQTMCHVHLYNYE